MSWNATVTSLPREDVRGKLDELLEQNYPEEDRSEGVVDQIDAAKMAMDALLDVAGDTVGTASISGHSSSGVENSWVTANVNWQPSTEA